MEKFNVGDVLFVEKGGSGWRKIEGYTVTVISREEAEECTFVEGLGLEEGLFFVEVGTIYADDFGENDEGNNDYREIDFEEGSVWGIDDTGKLILK